MKCKNPGQVPWVNHVLSCWNKRVPVIGLLERLLLGGTSRRGELLAQVAFATSLGDRTGVVCFQHCEFAFNPVPQTLDPRGGQSFCQPVPLITTRLGLGRAAVIVGFRVGHVYAPYAWAFLFCKTR